MSFDLLAATEARNDVKQKFGEHALIQENVYYFLDRFHFHLVKYYPELNKKDKKNA